MFGSQFWLNHTLVNFLINYINFTDPTSGTEGIVVVTGQIEMKNGKKYIV